MMNQNPQQFTFTGNPVARLTKALRTPKQLTAIRALANRRRIDEDAECFALMKCQVADLTIWAASALIDWLKSEHFTSAINVHCVGCKVKMSPHSHSRLCFYCVLYQVANQNEIERLAKHLCFNHFQL
jgi:hypothetical protein